ncbi:MAG TPA: AlkA N-terminal domain-containing protein [Steroidobacteraceae bacterium]|nr:DNA-3-methyladenine glycosylase 2 family protein [Steroidobacteraceae bacterium]HQW09859.1 AlkA N-terminal domain-containing protein [Steroidobacteraceae bacterium]HQX48001.1 AlkA N-terminal domain-containing protein [Steroidobacteraceae bacterium]HQX78753.1 AlkA N-terminal domain-containing protein [Steroidobacteraceae bacterium]HQY70266.1 AlkA N-terminal domain-containing protein [Pseudomonadales bacterium]
MKLATRGPFDLEATVRVLQRRPTNRVDVWTDGRYRRVFETSRGLALAEVVDRGSTDAPDLRLLVRDARGNAAVRREVARTLRRLLGLDIDPAPLHARAAGEPAIRAAAHALRGLRPPRFASLFEAFASVVPFQQVSLDAGVAVVGRVVEKFGAWVEHGGERHRAFPTAVAIAAARPAALRACGLSAQKAGTLQAVAAVISRGELHEEQLEALTTADAIARLTALKGVGPWTAGLVLLRGCGRLDVFPPGDVGADRNLRALLGTQDERKVRAAIARFGDLRGYLYFCALGGSLIARGLLTVSGDSWTRVNRDAHSPF